MRSTPSHEPMRSRSSRRMSLLSWTDFGARNLTCGETERPRPLRSSWVSGCRSTSNVGSATPWRCLWTRTQCRGHAKLANCRL